MKEQKQNNNKMKKRIYLNCGYEDACKKKDCLNCQKKAWHKINFTLAEEMAVEDFAMCDLDAMINGDKIKFKSGSINVPNKKDQIELMQNIMRKLMHKLFKSENKESWREG